MARKTKAAAKTASAPAASKPAEQKELPTGDVEQFPKHTFRADMGEGIPTQKDQLNPDRAK